MATDDKIFWGLVVKPEKRYEQIAEMNFHVSKAVLEPNSAGKGITSIYAEVDNDEFILAALQASNLNESLDLNFGIGEKICFRADGPGVIHLTGYLIPDQDDDDAMMFGGGSSDEEDASEAEEVPALVNGSNKKKRKGGADADDDQDVVKSAKKARKEAIQAAMKMAEELKQQAKAGGGDEEEESDDDDYEVVDGEEESDDDDGEEEESDDSDDDDDEEEDEMETETPPSSAEKKKKAANGDATPDSKKKDKKVKKEKAENKTPGKENKSVNGDSPSSPKKSPKTPKRTLKGGVTVEDLKVGNGPEAARNKMVGMFYEGRLQSNNKKFDGNFGAKPFKFRLGSGEVIKGWDIGVEGMKVNGRRRIVCPPKVAYGSSGAPPDIPPNATLVFEVECKFVK